MAIGARVAPFTFDRLFFASSVTVSALPRRTPARPVFGFGRTTDDAGAPRSASGKSAEQTSPTLAPARRRLERTLRTPDSESMFANVSRVDPLLTPRESARE